MNRRELIKTLMAAPLVGDVIQPCVIGILNNDGQTIVRDRETGAATSFMFMYGRVTITKDQARACRDDEALKRLIKAETDHMAEEFYRYIKGAAEGTEQQAWDLAEPLENDGWLVAMAREGGEFTQVR